MRMTSRILEEISGTPFLFYSLKSSYYNKEQYSLSLLIQPVSKTNLPAIYERNIICTRSGMNQQSSIFQIWVHQPFSQVKLKKKNNKFKAVIMISWIKFYVQYESGFNGHDTSLEFSLFTLLAAMKKWISPTVFL